MNDLSYGAVAKRGIVLTILMVVMLPLLGTTAAAQELNLSGFIEAENIYDTRQVAQVREGQFALFPLAQNTDAETGKDLKATHNLLFAASQSPIKLTGSGTEVPGAHLSGVIVTDFYG